MTPEELQADIKETEEMVEEIQKARNLKKVGKCNNCGKCCNLDMNILAIDLERNEVYEVGKRQTKRCSGWNEKEKKCDAYEIRPAICRVYPCTPNNLCEGCGFSFESTILKIVSESPSH